MNKHGQTLILFVILIPVILILLAVIVDTGYVYSKKVHVKEVTKQVIKECIDKDDEEIKDLFLKNKIDIHHLKIIRKEEKVEIQNSLTVESIFGSIIGIKKYDIKIDIIGYQQNGKVLFES